METCGIIAEYNPFHNGHRYQIANVRKRLGTNTGLIIAMSGDFVQRGGPAIADKWTRATWAVDHGADLVLELPVQAATETAERFAEGGIKLLQALGIVRHIAFGAETKDLQLLNDMAAVLSEEPPPFKEALNQAIADKTGFADARARALGHVLGDEAKTLISRSNAILAVSYLVAMKRQKAKFSPLLIERKGPDELASEKGEHFASASYIRNVLKKAFHAANPIEALRLLDVMPSDVLATLMSNGFQDELNGFERLFPHVLSRLISENKTDLLRFESMRPDLAMRLINMANERIDPAAHESFVNEAATRVYPASRARRALTDLYLGRIKATEVETPSLIRVLAFSRRGRYLLKLMKKYASLPIVTRNSDVRELQGAAKAELEASQKAADLYALLLNRRLRSDFDRTVIIG